MTLPTHPIPAPGFKLISGKRKPTEGEYMVQFRNGYIDTKSTYGPAQLVWIHDGGPWDAIAVKPV